MNLSEARTMQSGAEYDTTIQSPFVFSSASAPAGFRQKRLRQYLSNAGSADDRGLAEAVALERGVVRVEIDDGNVAAKDASSQSRAAAIRSKELMSYLPASGSGLIRQAQ